MTDSQKMPILQTRGLTVSYGNVEALRNASIQLEAEIGRAHV